MSGDALTWTSNSSGSAIPEKSRLKRWPWAHTRAPSVEPVMAAWDSCSVTSTRLMTSIRSAIAALLSVAQRCLAGRTSRRAAWLALIVLAGRRGGMLAVKSRS